MNDSAPRRLTDAASIEVRRLSPHIGAEIGGIDLTRPIGESQASVMREALLEHLVIFFRHQPIDVEQLKALGRCFGELHIHTGMKGMEEHPEVRRFHIDGESKHVPGEEWHTDLSCDPIPPMGSILYLHTVPPVGGDTLFASMYAAYEALSPQMRAYLERLTATHDGARAFKRFNPEGSYPLSVHPVIPRHPETGRRLLYVNQGFTSHINELPPAESAAVLAFLYQHCARPEFQVRFSWEPHSIAFWDNRCTQHLAIWDYYPQVRSGFRVQIKGVAAPVA